MNKKSIINHIPAALIRNLKTYNIINNSNLKLDDLHVNIIDNNVLQYGKYVYADYNYDSYYDKYHNTYIEIKKWLEHLLNESIIIQHEDEKNEKYEYFYENQKWGSHIKRTTIGNENIFIVEMGVWNIFTQHLFSEIQYIIYHELVNYKDYFNDIKPCDISKNRDYNPYSFKFTESGKYSYNIILPSILNSMNLFSENDENSDLNLSN